MTFSGIRTESSHSGAEANKAQIDFTGNFANTWTMEEPPFENGTSGSNYTTELSEDLYRKEM